MNNFIFSYPTKVYFGKGCVKEYLASLLRGYGPTVMLAYGGGSLKKSGVYDQMISILAEAGKTVVAFGGIMPNPTYAKVQEGARLARENHVDFILAVGGGSVIDSAKAIGYGVTNEGDVWDFYDRRRQASACLPVGVVLTIAAAGSEMSSSSVITKEEGGIKRGYSSNLCRPRFAVMNPELTMTLPPYQTACGCTDILMHTLERYFTNNGGNMELTDGIAEALLRTVIKNAVILRDDPENYGARAEVMWAGSLSHNGLTGCGNGGDDFSVHALEHELSGMYDVAHGAGLAAVWGSWARYVYRECLPRFEQFAVRVMGVPAGTADTADTALRGIEALEAFFRSIGMPTSLRELGVEPSEQDLLTLSRKCGAATGGTKGSAKKLHEPDMLAIYRMAL